MRMIAIILSAFLAVSCSQEEHYYFYEGNTQGTTFHIVYSLPDSIDYSYDVDSILQKVNVLFSTYDTTSVISRINRNQYDQVLDPLFIDMFNKSMKVYKASGGAFDPTVGPLIDFWGFGRSHKKEVDTARLPLIMQNIGLDKVKIVKGKLVKEKPGIKLNFNAIAQGYTVDLVADYFEKKGVHNYMVEIGGELRVKGVNNKGGKWRIGIDKPVDGNIEPGGSMDAIVGITDLAVSTSGNYRNYYVENGVKYSHTINPVTGYPARNSLLSATIFAKDCTTADAFATAMMVLGIEKACRLADKMSLDVYLIYTDAGGRYQKYVSKAVEKMIEK